MLIFLKTILLTHLKTTIYINNVCVYAQAKKVTWNVYAHAQFSGGLYQDKASIFLLNQIIVDYWCFFDLPGNRACV